MPEASTLAEVEVVLAEALTSMGPDEAAFPKIVEVISATTTVEPFNKA